MNIQWYPGHMTKTRRQIEQDLHLVDAVCEIVDARIPRSSRNPDLDAVCGKKPRMIVLNRIDMADPAMTAQWASYFRKQGMAAIETDCKHGRGVGQFVPAMRTLLRGKLQHYAEKGEIGRPLRVMVVGIPNVGKSAFINQVAGRRSAKIENRPGVTRGRQWITVDRGLELLDTPGILWPKLDDQEAAYRLAYTGAVKDTVVDQETLAVHLMELLAEDYPQALEQRYKLSLPSEHDGQTLLELVGRKRGMLISGGEVDIERMSRVLLEEFRSCRLGRFTLDRPDKGEEDCDEA